MAVPTDRKYSREHEWVKVERGDQAVVGITDFAQEELGDIVYVELPSVGAKVGFMKTFGVAESVKAASDLFSPVTGEVTEVNERLTEQPELVNQDPYGDGWMLRVKIADPGELDQLLSAADYGAMIG